MTAADLHTLTGAYVLHALEPGERAAFEGHLDACPPCAQEVRELAATAARLGSAAAVSPPPALKEQVLRRIATERQDPPRGRARSRPSGGGGARGRAMSRFALAACLAAAAAFGGVAAWQQRAAQDARGRAEAAEQRSQAVVAVLAAPDAKLATARLPSGANSTVVVSRGQDKAVFLTSGLPKAPRGMVYQLWYDDGGTMRGAGLMDPAAESDAVLLAGPVGAASGMGLTVEPAGGSAHPTSDPLVLLSFPAT
ncbi:anti-sigma factor [Streptomyces sp. NPDC095613]|uniref:anti-sigma factor n=1 Tax=Streptomyces sp. NPDC095613 TaxID=3155540 RepID=UPI003328B9B7